MSAKKNDPIGNAIAQSAADIANAIPIANGNGKPKGGAAKAGTKEAAARQRRAAGSASGLTPAEKRLLEDTREPSTKDRRLPTEAERLAMVAEAEADGAEAAEAIVAATNGRVRNQKGKGGNGPEWPDTPPEAEANGKGPKGAKGPRAGKGGPKGTEVAVIGQPLVPEVEDEDDSPTELRELTEAEAAEKADLIASGQEALRQTREAGAAFGVVLADIKERGLYQDTHTSFHAFASEVFHIEKRSVRYIIGHAKAVERLRLSGAEVLPDSQRTARPLLTVYPEAQAEVWAKAVELARAEGTTPKERHSARAAEESGKRRPGRPKGSTNKPKGPASGTAPGATQVEDDRITSARLAGTIPEGAEVATTEHEGGPEGAEAPMSDDEYLDQFKIRDNLTVATRRIFDVSAIGYRRIAEARRAFITDHLAPAVKYAEGIAKESGPYLGLLRWVLKKGDPSTWVVCDSCKGTGEIAKGGGECPACKRAGFHVR
jgi:hypothetical protein